MKNTPHGFTLIELLIVVAIIGILAAIAVPNFLNAQLKARVARCKADLKAIGVGMEQYFIDHNDYPPSLYLHWLTSPIPYLSSVARDVFPPKFVKNSPQSDGWSGWAWYRYIRTSTNADQRRGSATCADYWAYYPPYALRSQALSLSSERGCPVIWYVKSYGPNANKTSLCGDNNGDDCTLRYDPTNGLVSIGDIAVFGPGAMVN